MALKKKYSNEGHYKKLSIRSRASQREYGICVRLSLVSSFSLLSSAEIRTPFQWFSSKSMLDVPRHEATFLDLPAKQPYIQPVDVVESRRGCKDSWRSNIFQMFSVISVVFWFFLLCKKFSPSKKCCPSRIWCLSKLRVGLKAMQYINK